MRLAIITECALSRAHGTGAQMLRLLAGSADPFVHYYFSADYAGLSEYPNSHRLQDPAWRWRGKRLAMRIERQLGWSWWDGNGIDRQKFHKLQSKLGHSAEVAYVVVACERDAERAVSMVSELRCPYIVHVMDIYHAAGLCPETMPGFTRLLSGACSVVALNDAIARELRKFEVSRVVTIPFGRPIMSAAARPPERTISVLMAGKPYSIGTQLIAHAWPQIVREFPHAELAYIGQHFSSLPRDLRCVVRNHGYIADDAAFDRVLTESHLAFLSGPSDRGHFSRYSIPSRTGDFLMAGLPMLACVAPDEPTGQFLTPLIPRSVRLVQTGGELIEGVRAFLASHRSWLDASWAARRFAIDRLAIDAVRQQIWGELGSAVGGDSRRMALCNG